MTALFTKLICGLATQWRPPAAVLISGTKIDGVLSA